MREKALALREERAKIIAEAHRILADDSTSAEDRNSRFDELMAKSDELKGEIDRIELLLRTEEEMESRVELAAAKNEVSTDQQTAEEAQEEADFRAYLLGGFNNLTPEALARNQERNAKLPPDVRAAMSIGVGDEGGYTVPEGFQNKLEIAALAYAGGMIDPNVVTVLRTSSGNPLPMPTSDDTSNTGERIAENTQVAAQDVAFGQIMLNAWLYSSKVVKVPVTLMQDSAFDMNSFLAGRLGERIGRIWNTDLTVGAGTAGIPNGIVTASTLGKTLAGAAAITELELIDLEHSVDPAYRVNGRYMFSDAVLALLRKLVDGDSRPVFSAGMNVGEYDRIHGYPYTINQSVPAPTTGLKSVIFGDLKKYQTRIALGMTLLRLTERYADYLQVGFLAFARADGDLLDAGTNPVKHAIQA
jgi:HK97 family phage major capsid protein